MSEQVCATCRHWREKPPQWKGGELVPDDWHFCARLFVVTQRAHSRPFDTGDVVSERDVIAHSLGADYLHTAPSFSCGQWQTGVIDPNTIWDEEGA